MTNPVTTFADRHIGPNLADKRAMLATLGVPSVETLIAQAVPKSIRLGRPLDLPEPASEADGARRARRQDERQPGSEELRRRRLPRHASCRR